jgi:hypothetical protein
VESATGPTHAGPRGSTLVRGSQQPVEIVTGDRFEDGAP